jgi:hypothetical protein
MNPPSRVPYNDGLSLDLDHETPDNRSQDFDWAELERRLGEASSDEADLEKAGEILRLGFKWALEADCLSGKKFAKKFSRRMVALMWVIDPGYFSGEKLHPSLSQLARNMGIDKVVLSRNAASVTRTFGIKNRFQHAHGGKLKGGDDGTA